jgi:hypothetical protein
MATEPRITTQIHLLENPNNNAHAAGRDQSDEQGFER